MTMAMGFSGGKAVRVVKRGKVAITEDARRTRRKMWWTMRREGWSDDAIGEIFDRCPRHVRREIRAFQQAQALEGRGRQEEEGRARRRTA